MELPANLDLGQILTWAGGILVSAVGAYFGWGKYNEVSPAVARVKLVWMVK